MKLEGQMELFGRQNAIENSIEQKLEMPKTSAAPHKDDKRLGDCYGVGWKWLYGYFDENQAKHALYGIQNLNVPHDILIRMPQVSYIPSLYIGADLEKRSVYAKKKESLPRFGSVEELLSHLIDVGRVNNLRTEKDHIQGKLRRALKDVTAQKKASVLESFYATYIPAYHESRDGPNFLDAGYDAEETRAYRLKQFRQILNDKYRAATR
jgi:hypothetical protein